MVDVASQTRRISLFPKAIHRRRWRAAEAVSQATIRNAICSFQDDICLISASHFFETSEYESGWVPCLKAA